MVKRVASRKKRSKSSTQDDTPLNSSSQISTQNVEENFAASISSVQNNSSASSEKNLNEGIPVPRMELAASSERTISAIEEEAVPIINHDTSLAIPTTLKNNKRKLNGCKHVNFGESSEEEPIFNDVTEELETFRSICIPQSALRILCETRDLDFSDVRKYTFLHLFILYYIYLLT